MSSEFTNLTLTAHDPSFPKPRGLLPVPQAIDEAVAREEARITQEHGFVIAPRQGSERSTNAHVFGEGRSVVLLGNDVVDREGQKVERLREPTVFAGALGAVPNQTFQRLVHRVRRQGKRAS